MKNFSIITALFLLAARVLPAQAPLTWSAERFLTWADFQGTPSREDTTIIAVTHCSIVPKICRKNTWTGKITVAVEATFYPDKSWYRSPQVHELTLRHEQGHFDITEWFARKLRMVIAEEISSVTDYKKKFQAAYNKIYAEYYQTQKMYEIDTGYGTAAAAQSAWESRIKSALQALDVYSKTGCN